MPPSKIIPFYNVVRSAPTKPSFGAPPPTPRTCTSRHRTVPIPPAPRYASNNIVKDELISESGGRAHSGSTSTDSNPRLQELRKVLKDKRDALYHRLSRQDTVSSSKMKPIPLDCQKIGSCYENEQKAAETPSRFKGFKTTKFMTVSSFVGQKLLSKIKCFMLILDIQLDRKGFLKAAKILGSGILREALLFVFRQVAFPLLISFLVLLTC